MGGSTTHARIHRHVHTHTRTHAHDSTSNIYSCCQQLKLLGVLLHSECFEAAVKDPDDQLYRLQAEFKRVEKHWEREDKDARARHSLAQKKLALEATAMGECGYS